MSKVLDMLGSPVYNRECRWEFVLVLLTLLSKALSLSAIPAYLGVSGDAIRIYERLAI